MSTKVFIPLAIEPTALGHFAAFIEVLNHGDKSKRYGAVKKLARIVRELHPEYPWAFLYYTGMNVDRHGKKTLVFLFERSLSDLPETQETINKLVEASEAVAVATLRITQLEANASAFRKTIEELEAQVKRAEKRARAAEDTASRLQYPDTTGR